MTRPLLTLIVVWTMLCGAAFVTLFSMNRTDDVAGFVIAMLVLQVPAFAAMARAPDGVPLSAGRCVAIALPAAMVGGFASFFVLGTILDSAFRSQLGDARGLLLAFAIALTGCVGTGLLFGLYLARRPHPIAGRRLLSWFGLANLAGAIVVIALARHGDAALVVVMATMVAWVVPMLVATLREAPDLAPVARVVR